MRNEKEKLEKRDLVFSDPQERKTDRHPTFSILPFDRHTSLHYVKVKELNLPTHNCYIFT